MLGKNANICTSLPEVKLLDPRGFVSNPLHLLLGLLSLQNYGSPGTALCRVQDEIRPEHGGTFVGNNLSLSGIPKNPSGIIWLWKIV